MEERRGAEDSGSLVDGRERFVFDFLSSRLGLAGNMAMSEVAGLYRLPVSRSPPLRGCPIFVSKSGG